MAKITKKEETVVAHETPVVSEKVRLLALYKTLADLGVRSISDLENLIAKAE